MVQLLGTQRAYPVVTIHPATTAILFQVERQIDQMVRFIKQEAEEKANEIKVSGEEVCSLLLPTDLTPSPGCSTTSSAHTHSSEQLSCKAWSPCSKRCRDI